MQPEDVLFSVRYSIGKRDYHEIAEKIAFTSVWGYYIGAAVSAVLTGIFGLLAAWGVPGASLLAQTCLYITALLALFPVIIYLSLRINYHFANAQPYGSVFEPKMTSVSFTEEMVILEEENNRIVWHYDNIEDMLETNNWYLLRARRQNRLQHPLSVVAVKKQCIPFLQRSDFSNFIQVKLSEQI